MGEGNLLALRFLTLTAVRSGEVRIANWDGIDGDLWRIPADRTKTDLPHIVPIVDETLQILQRARILSGGGGLFFPGTRIDRPLSDMTLSKRMKSLGFKDHDGCSARPHDLRASFKTWSRHF